MFERMDLAMTALTEEFEAMGRESERPDDEALIASVQRFQQIINAATAAQSVRMAQFAAREDVRHEDGTVTQRDFPLGHVSPFASAVVGPELGLAPGAAEERVRVAARIASTMRGTLDAMAGGGFDWLRARALATELADTPAEVVAEVEEHLFPAVMRDSTGEARRRCRRVLLRVDADSLVERAKRSREGRSLQRWHGEPGTAEWHAVLPAEQAAKAWEAIDTLARSYQREDRQHGDRPATLEQARSDALVDLILGNAGVTTTVVFAVPETFARLPQAPHTTTGPSDAATGAVAQAKAAPADTLVEVAGAGPVPWSAFGPLTTAFATRISIASCDPESGVLTGMATEVYRPPAELQRFVKRRDGSCRFPGCSAATSRCDIDHVVTWPVGPTDRTNLMSLCRRHHRTKQRPGWRVSMDGSAVITWTNPLGHTFTTHPADHRGSGRTG